MDVDGQKVQLNLQRRSVENRAGRLVEKKKYCSGKLPSGLTGPDSETPNRNGEGERRASDAPHSVTYISYSPVESQAPRGFFSRLFL